MHWFSVKSVAIAPAAEPILKGRRVNTESIAIAIQAFLHLLLVYIRINKTTPYYIC